MRESSADYGVDLQSKVLDPTWTVGLGFRMVTDWS